MKACLAHMMIVDAVCLGGDAFAASGLVHCTLLIYG